jgi:hypothetical protein
MAEVCVEVLGFRGFGVCDAEVFTYPELPILRSPFCDEFYFHKIAPTD